VAFTLYLIFVTFVFIKPFEIIVPDMAQFNPMIYFAIFTLIASVPHAINGKQRVITSLHVACFTGLIVAIALSWLSKGWMGGAVQSLLRSAPALVLFVLTLILLTSRQRLYALLITVSFLVTLISAITILDYHYALFNGLFVLRQTGLAQDYRDFLSTDTSGMFSDNSLRRLRWVGELSDPNDLGQVLVMSLPLTLLYWRSNSHFRNLILVITPALTLLYGIWLTQSRGAFVSVAVLLFVAIFRLYGRGFALFFSPIVVIALALAGGTGGREFSSTEASASGRLEAWSAGIDMLKSNVFSGVGYGAFLDHHVLTAHNSFVLVFAELGLFGYFFWFGLISLSAIELSKGYHARDSTAPPPRELICIFFAFLGYFVCAWFLSRSYSNSFFLLVSTTICAGRLAYLTISPSSRVDTVLWLRRTTVYSLLSILAVYSFLIFNNIFLR
jgi:putative inorganic carbon (hco3(-)) transporter